MKQFILSLAMVLGITSLCFGQAASPGPAVTQTGSTGLAAQQCLTVTGTNANVLTIPSPGGSSSNYIDFLDMAEEQTGAVTPTAPVPFTSTGIAGTPSFTAPWANPATGIVSHAGGPVGGVFTTPLKGLTGQAVTFTTPATETGNSFRITACYHVSP